MEQRDDNRRHYRRSSHFHCDATVSADGTHFVAAVIEDLSSGGLQFRAAGGCTAGQELSFRLHIHGFLFDFAIKVRGVIRRADDRQDFSLYGVKFLDMPHDAAIRIDEGIRRDRLVSGMAYEND